MKFLHSSISPHQNHIQSSNLYVRLVSDTTDIKWSKYTPVHQPVKPKPELEG